MTWGYKLFIDRGRHGYWVQSIHWGIDISRDFYTWCNSRENWWGGKGGYSSELDQWSQSKGKEKRSRRCWWELFVWLKRQSLEGSPKKPPGLREYGKSQASGGWEREESSGCTCPNTLAPTMQSGQREAWLHGRSPMHGSAKSLEKWAACCWKCVHSITWSWKRNSLGSSRSFREHTHSNSQPSGATFSAPRGARSWSPASDLKAPLPPHTESPESLHGSLGNYRIHTVLSVKPLNQKVSLRATRLTESQRCKVHKTEGIK